MVFDVDLRTFVMPDGSRPAPHLVHDLVMEVLRPVADAPDGEEAAVVQRGIRRLAQRDPLARAVAASLTVILDRQVLARPEHDDGL